MSGMSASPVTPPSWLKRFEQAAKLALVPPVGYHIVRLLGRTMTLRRRGMEHVDRLLDRRQPMIIAFWHAQQLMMPLARPGFPAHVLISRHRDGELIRRVAARFGLQAVRGSSTRGGREAFRELIRLGRAGTNLVLTPDGPKGPPQVAKVGIVQLARATGMPIVPMAFGCSKKNSSRAGTASSCPIRSRGDCFSWRRRSSCRLRRPSTTWNACAANWKPR